MYGKIFKSIYDGTLSEDWKALVTFQQMIVLCDADGIIDMTPSAMSRQTSIPIEIILAGIESLEREDPESRTSTMDGKRIVRIDESRKWGWYIINHDKYKLIVTAEDKRGKAKLRKRKQRDSHVQSRSVTLSHAVSRMSRHTDTDTDTNTNTKDQDQDQDQNIKLKKIKDSKKIHYPDWLNIDLFQAYVNNRKFIKSPMSDKAQILAIKKLERLITEGQDQTELIERAIESNWKSFYAKSTEGNNYAKSHKPKLTAVERVRAACGLDEPSPIIDITSFENSMGKDD